MKLSISLLFILIFSFGAVSALELTDDTTAIGVNINPVVTISSSGSSGNATDWNTTSLGVLTDASSSQFSSVGGTLTILTSYLNAGWCKLTGCDIDGDLSVTGTATIGDNILINYNDSTNDIEITDTSKTLVNTTMDYTNGTLENVTTNYDIKEDFIDMIYDENGTLITILSYKNGILTDNSSLTYVDGNVVGVIPNG